MVAISALPIAIVAIAVVTTASLSLITLATVIFVYRRRQRKVKPVNAQVTENGSSQFDIEEGKISFTSVLHLAPQVVVSEENQDIEPVQESVQQPVTTLDEEQNREENALKRTPSQDSACFTASPRPACPTCLHPTHSDSDSDDEDGEEHDATDTGCAHVLKRDWTEIDVSLPEVYTSSRESLLDAVVSAAVA
jgi:hypothetical protein